MKMKGIVTAVSIIDERSAGRGLRQKKRFDPEKCQKEIFAPLPAVLLVRRLYGGLAGRLTLST
ncbi:MAG: hypothetical protein GQ555_07560 [Desulfobacterales bacterium]|nr:hypothetical protein [Desulfobacterales bacterium]